MSTWYPYRLTCPGCGVVGELRILKGLHIRRLPKVKEDIREGRFQRYTCAGCGGTWQVEAPSVYTDFTSGHYIAVEAPFPPNVAAVKARCREVFDACFTFGPDVAADLGRSIVFRVAFGVAALREKVLVWDAGLDDRVVEALKLEILAEEGVDRRSEVLRLTTLVAGRHLLFARLRPPAAADARWLDPVPGGAIPAGSPHPAAGERASLACGCEPAGFVTVPQRRYEQALGRRAVLLREHPWLRDDWVVDAFHGG